MNVPRRGQKHFVRTKSRLLLSKEVFRLLGICGKVLEIGSGLKHVSGSIFAAESTQSCISCDIPVKVSLRSHIRT